MTERIYHPLCRVDRGNVEAVEGVVYDTDVEITELRKSGGRYLLCVHELVKDLTEPPSLSLTLEV